MLAEEEVEAEGELKDNGGGEKPMMPKKNEPGLFIAFNCRSAVVHLLLLDSTRDNVPDKPLRSIDSITDCRCGTSWSPGGSHFWVSSLHRPDRGPTWAVIDVVEWCVSWRIQDHGLYHSSMPFQTTILSPDL